jgi:hypothetical protein
MPKYNITTRERRWVECTYIVEANDASDAIKAVVEDGDIEPRSITTCEGQFDSADCNVQLLELVDESQEKP